MVDTAFHGLFDTSNNSGLALLQKENTKVQSHSGGEAEAAEAGAKAEKWVGRQ